MLNKKCVAMKSMMATEGAMLSPRDFAAFYAEVFRTASLKSDYVVHVYGVTKSGSVLMELANNDLSSWYGTSRGLREKLNVLEQAAKALHYVHEKGVVHRDVKSTNSLMFGDGTSPKVKIADFGLAMKKVDVFNSVATRVMGTLHWMAPELFKGHCPDEKSDVYSFGAVMYEVMTGCIPYSGLLDPAIRRKKLEGNPPGDFKPGENDISAQELRNLMKMCCTLKPEDRPTMEVVSRRLKEIAAGMSSN